MQICIYAGYGFFHRMRVHGRNLTFSGMVPEHKLQLMQTSNLLSACHYEMFYLKYSMALNIYSNELNCMVQISCSMDVL